MSSRISVRVAGGQVVHVPPMCLDWASKHPRLIELVDQIGEIISGQTGEGKTTERLQVMGEFVDEVRAISKHEGEIDVDVNDVARLHAALRGVDIPDPTPPRPDG